MSKPGYTHFLVTRFNLRNPEWQADKNKQQCLTDEWLRDRFHLFETFCYPSVQQQSSQDFIWLCFFDNETPDAYRGRIAQLPPMPNFRPLFIDGMNDLPAQLKAEIDARAGDATHIITTRLDNDDAVHRDFVAAVQRAFAGQAFTTVNVTDGYQLMIQDGRFEVCTAHFPYNPFISLIEARNGFQTILSKSLPEWKEESRRGYLIQDRHLWAQVVHGRNYANKKNATSFYTTGFEPQQFGIPAGAYRPVSPVVVIAKNTLVFVRKAGRRLIRTFNELKARTR